VECGGRAALRAGLKSYPTTRGCAVGRRTAERTGVDSAVLRCQRRVRSFRKAVPVYMVDNINRSGGWLPDRETTAMDTQVKLM